MFVILVVEFMQLNDSRRTMMSTLLSFSTKKVCFLADPYEACHKAGKSHWAKRAEEDFRAFHVGIPVQVPHVHLAPFEAEEKELVEVIGTLERATGILEKELSKSGASMMQLQSASSVVQALSVMVEATSLSSADATKLTQFLQSSQSDEDSSDDLGAPAADILITRASSITTKKASSSSLTSKKE